MIVYDNIDLYWTYFVDRPYNLLPGSSLYFIHGIRLDYIFISNPMEINDMTINKICTNVYAVGLYF